MWISSKRYDELFEENWQMRKDKDTLIRLLSGVVVGKGGKIKIPMPSTDTRTLRWGDNKDGSVTIESEIYNLTKGELST